MRIQLARLYEKGLAPMVALAALFLAINTAMFLMASWYSSIALRSFSYSGEDYPYQLADLNVGPAEMTFEDTVRLSANGTLADQEWLSLRVPKEHLGYIRLGEKNRLFAIAMYHDLHCVNTFRLALVDPDGPDATEHHVQHCLNYLRQLFLCKADTYLEPHDWTSRNYSTGPVNAPRKCKDWSAVYQYASDNYKDFRELGARMSKGH